MAFASYSNLVVLNADALPTTVDEPRTFFVVGTARGGTSAVALFLRELGIFMGERPDPLTHEDQRLLDARQDLPALETVIGDYNAAHPIWGFKLPNGPHIASKIVPLLRKPILIAVVRNPLATVRGRLSRGKREADQKQTLFLRMFSNVQREGTSLARWLLQDYAAPVLFVEYERIIADPKTFSAEVVAQLRIEPTAENLERAIAAVSAPGYKPVTGVILKKQERREKRKKRRAETEETAS